MVKVVYFEGFWTVEDVISNPNCLFVFGDNDRKKGKKGQAIIRDLDNTVGVPTKKEPNHTGYYNDNEFDLNKTKIDAAINEIKRRSIDYEFIVLPKDGLGTGLAKLPEKAPKTYQYLIECLNKLKYEQMIKGLHLKENFINENEEKLLLDYINNQEWSTELTRRTQHYGYHYSYKSGKLTPTVSLDGPILELANYLNKRYDLNINQCIVNEYNPGQGISPHVDNKQFDWYIISLSLNSNSIMIFTKNEDEVDVLINRRSLVILTEESRYSWKHSIKGSNVKNKRISITYRNVK